MNEEKWLDICEREDVDAVMGYSWSMSDLLRGLIREAMRDVKGPAAEVIRDHCWRPTGPVGRALDTK